MSSATDEELLLHNRLLQGDLTASAEITDMFLTELINLLKRDFQSLALRDETKLWDAATEAILNYSLSPKTYDPRKKTLRGYLFFSAKNDLITANTKLKLIDSREKLSDPVELRDLAQNKDIRGPSVDSELEYQDIWNRIKALVHDPIEQRVIALMLEREFETAAYAEVMGITNKDPKLQAIEVKRMKDKLRKRLQRAGWEGIILKRKN